MLKLLRAISLLWACIFIIIGLIPSAVIPIQKLKGDEITKRLNLIKDLKQLSYSFINYLKRKEEKIKKKHSII